jgi:hypothetical protein
VTNNEGIKSQPDSITITVNPPPSNPDSGSNMCSKYGSNQFLRNFFGC